MVTDGEIDRFFVRLIDYCFNNVTTKSSSITKTPTRVIQVSNKSTNNSSVSTRLQRKKAINIQSSDSNETFGDSSITTDDENKENDIMKNK